MNGKTSLALALIFLSALSLGASSKKKGPQRGMLEKMEAVPCGAKQKGVTGFGAIWASVGITSVNSNEKLCPQYLVRTDENEYEIRPVDAKHPVVLPIGHEGTFRIKKDHMLLTAVDGGDGKTRTYQVVGVKPTNSDTAEQSSDTSKSDTVKSDTVKSADTIKSPDPGKSTATPSASGEDNR